MLLRLLFSNICISRHEKKYEILEEISPWQQQFSTVASWLL